MSTYRWTKDTPFCKAGNTCDQTKLVFLANYWGVLEDTSVIANKLIAEGWLEPADKPMTKTWETFEAIKHLCSTNGIISKGMREYFAANPMNETLNRKDCTIVQPETIYNPTTGLNITVKKLGSPSGGSGASEPQPEPENYQCEVVVDIIMEDKPVKPQPERYT